MIRKYILDNSEFSKITQYFLNISSKIQVNQILSDLNITSLEFNHILSVLRNNDYDFNIKEVNYKLYIYPLGVERDEKSSMSKKNSFLSTIKNQEICLLDDYVDVIERNGGDSSITISDILTHDDNEGIVKFLTESIKEKKSVCIKTLESYLILFPRLVVYLGEDLCLISENTKNNSLLKTPINTIINCNEYLANFTPEYSNIEINNFIKSFRMIGDSSVRLILKIYSRVDFNSFMGFQYLEKPCLVTNSDGEYIWAATLEKNEEVFKWLFKLGPEVEILDPTSFKREFIEYCELRLKKLA